MNIVANFIAFQIGWFGCVLSAAHGQPWLGVLIVAVVVLWHLLTAHQPGREAVLIACAGIIGGVWDSLLVASGWLDYPSGMLFPLAAPYWIVAMWVLFATTLNVSLRWLKNRYVLAAVVGACAGPLAYFGGGELGGLSFNNTTLALTALAIGWAVFMPILMALSNRYDGTRRPVARAVGI